MSNSQPAFSGPPEMDIVRCFLNDFGSQLPTCWVSLVRGPQRLGSCLSINVEHLVGCTPALGNYWSRWRLPEQRFLVGDALQNRQGNFNKTLKLEPFSGKFNLVGLDRAWVYLLGKLKLLEVNNLWYRIPEKHVVMSVIGWVFTKLPSSSVSWMLSPFSSHSPHLPSPQDQTHRYACLDDEGFHWCTHIYYKYIHIIHIYREREIYI